MRLLRAFGRFWYDFIVGDDWRIAAGIVLVLAVGAGLVAVGDVSDNVLMPVISTCIFVVFAASLIASLKG